MSEPAAANDHEQHTTTIEITGNGQINAAFENTEGPDGEPTPQTPPPAPNHIQRPSTPPPQVPRPNTPPPPTPQNETTHINGETPHMNGETKTNGVELRTPGSEDTKEVNEAVNLELVNMQPYSNSIPIKKESTELDIGDPYDEYFVPVNQHKKYMRGEKLYVTQDKRRSLGGSKKKCCWGVLTVIVLGGIVAILIGVILSSQDNVPVEESRNFNGIKASIGGGIIPTPSPSSTPPPTRPTTDMSEIYLSNVLQGELTIDNLEFTPGLADKNSSEFRNLAASLEEELKSALFDRQTLHYGSADITVKVLEFRSGSVIVVYRVGWEFKDGVKNPPDPIDKDGLKTRLQEHLRSHDGFLYNYRLTLHNLKSERVTNACKIDNGGCSQNCMFDKSILEIMCVCEEPNVLDRDGKTCIIPEKGESGSSAKDDTMNTSEKEHDMKHEHGIEQEHSMGHKHSTEHEPSMEHEHGMGHEHSMEHENSTEHDEHGMEHEHEHGMGHEHGMEQEHEEEQVHESSSEVNLTSEDQNKNISETDELPMAEHSSENAYHVETEMPPDHQNFGVKDTSIETYVTPLPEHIQDTRQTSEPLSEHNTQHMYENTNYNPTENPQFKNTSESDGVQAPMMEDNNSAETVSKSSNDFPIVQTTEPIPQMKSTEVSMDFDSSSESKYSSGMPTYPNPMNFSEPVWNQYSKNSMESIYSTPLHPNEDMSSDAIPETTPMPPFNMNSGEYNNPLHHSMESTEVSVDNTNPYEPSSTSPATSSERLAKYKQFPDGGLEDSSYMHTEKDLMHETTDMPKELAGEQNTMPGLSELNNHQSSENSSFDHSLPHPTISYTEMHEEIPTEKIYSDNSEMKSSGFFTSQNNENMITTASVSYTELKQDGNSTEEKPTTKNSLNDEEAGAQPANISADSGYISSTDLVEEINNNQKMTTMMPLIQREEVNQSSMLMTSDPKSSIFNNSQSSESITENPADEPTTQASLKMDNMGSSLNTFKTEEVSMDSMTITTPSSTSIVESVTMATGFSEPSESENTNEQLKNLNSSNIDQTLSNTEPVQELNMGTTEMPMRDDSVITTGLNGTTNNMNLETETTQPILGINNVHRLEEPKIPSPEESDSTIPTFLVGGENMPPIALTPNPDLSGPYSVDSTIQPIPEEEDVEEVKSTGSYHLGGPSDSEGHHQWYDSKNGLNSLDDDYNEEEKYNSYKLTKGKPEHVTKGYKSIKLEDKTRLPEDSDAVEQTHSHQIEQVPITTSESSNTAKLLTTETNESSTTFPPSEGPPSKVKEEEKLLIEEVHTEATRETMRPDIGSEHLYEPKSENQGFSGMTTEMSMDPNDMPENHHKDTDGDSEIKETKYTSTLDAEKIDNHNVEAADANPTTSAPLYSLSGSTSSENLPTTILYESHNKTECDSEHFACHDGSKCLMKLQQCDSLQDCADGSDEKECEKLNCVENFKCNDGTCLSKHLVCNGIQNCPDGNDEENCDPEKKGEKKEYIVDQLNATEPKGTESPAGIMGLQSTDSIGNSPNGNTDIPATLKETTNIATEPSVMKDEEGSGPESLSMKPVIIGTESPLNSIETGMDGKAPESRSMEAIVEEPATPAAPMLMDSKVSDHTEPSSSSTESAMENKASLNLMESVNEGTEPPQMFTDSYMKTNETPIPSAEPPSSMDVSTGDKEVPVSPMESASDTEHPTMTIESNMKTNESAVNSLEINNAEKPLNIMDVIVDGRESSLNVMESVNGGTEASVKSMETDMNNNEPPATTMIPVVSNTEIPAGGVSSDSALTSIPAGEVLQISNEATSNNSTANMMSSETELPSMSSVQTSSSSAQPEYNTKVDSSESPSVKITESQVNENPDTSSSQVAISNTEPSPTTMEPSTSHPDKSSKITEPVTQVPDDVPSSNESGSNSTELPPDLMEQFPIQTALS